MSRLLPLLLASTLALACTPKPAASTTPSAPELDEASGPAASWSYEITLDDTLEHMRLALCIEGPTPTQLEASRGALSFVESAQVRGGPALRRTDEGFTVETLGEHGCLDFEIDLAAATTTDARDSTRRGDTIMLGPVRWLWHPTPVPARLEARARFHLPAGVAATVPWPDQDQGAQGWRRLDRSAFGWNAWVAFGRYQPIELEFGECELEVAVLDGDRAASDAGIEQWLRVAAQSSIELYGELPRERVAVVVIPAHGWGDDPVLFGMARRGGGGSVMLVLDSDARDHELPGEWVAVHELLHLGMPLVGDPWMSEGFVTYYTQILRARLGLHEIATALRILANGFRRGRGGTRSLARASDNMRRLGNYSRVYWGGAAVALDLDLSIRRASEGRRSLDDLMIMLAALAPEYRRWSAAEVLELMDDELARWREAGELHEEISAARIAARHLEAESIPAGIERLDGLAVEIQSGVIRLLPNPVDQVRLRTGLFEPRAGTGTKP